MCVFVSNVEIDPAILKEVQVIHLSLSSVELKELMLSEIVQSENPDLWSQHFQIRRDKLSLEDKLYQEEVRDKTSTVF